MSAVLQMLAGLVAVIATIAGCAWLARRAGLAQASRGQLMKVVSAIHLGARERVVVVELQDQWLVLGIAPGRVSALATLPRGAVPEGAGGGALASGAAGFAALLDKARKHAAR
ncbi:MAG TPA: flagellar biosynthetic protein FliO [Burkholderiales bacterium]|nr:flagellar biosynthetic protein FliO [Burkholderiales bacterium]